MINALFVYGTLAPGRPNEHILKNIGGTWEEASVTGTLHQEGWGAEMGYPAIVLDDKGDEVEGYVFHSENIAAHWHELDEFEGKAYQRVVVKAKLKDGTAKDAYLYVLAKQE